MIQKKTTILVKLSISIFAFIFFLTILEGGLRIVGYWYSWESRQRQNFVHAGGGDMDKSGEIRLFSGQTRETNMGKDIEKKQLPAIGKNKRIVCVGDSYTFGGAGEYEETYPYQLEEIFKRRNNEENVSVINCGVCEYNSRQVLKRLPFFIASYSPRVIVLLVGNANRFNFALYDMNGNSFMGWFRTLRIYKMFKIVRLNMMNKLFGWRQKYTNDYYHDEKSNVRLSSDGIPLAVLRETLAFQYFSQMEKGDFTSENSHLYQKVWEYYRLGQFKKAIYLCNVLIKKRYYPDKTRCILSYIYLNIDKIEDAIAAYEDAYRLYPRSDFVLSYQAYFSREVAESKGYDTVERWCQAIEVQPFLIMERGYRLVHCYLLQSEYDAAYVLSFFQKLLEKYPDLIHDPYFVKYYAFFKNQKKWEKKIARWLEEDLDQIVMLCQQNNIQLVIQNYPYAYPLANGILEKTSVKHKLPFVDHYSIFKKIVTKENEKEYFVDDHHCTQKGHEIMAENVYNVLVNGVFFFQNDTNTAKK